MLAPAHARRRGRLQRRDDCGMPVVMTTRSARILLASAAQRNMNYGSTGKAPRSLRIAGSLNRRRQARTIGRNTSNSSKRVRSRIRGTSQLSVVSR